jgi:hypothetical protein
MDAVAERHLRAKKRTGNGPKRIVSGGGLSFPTVPTWRDQVKIGRSDMRKVLPELAVPWAGSSFDCPRRRGRFAEVVIGDDPGTPGSVHLLSTTMSIRRPSHV